MSQEAEEKGRQIQRTTRNLDRLTAKGGLGCAIGAGAELVIRR